MKKINLFGINEFELYTTAEQLPAVRYKDFQKFLLLDSGVGSDMESINARFSNFLTFQANKRYDEATREAENLYYTFYAISQGLNYRQLAFGALVHSINGVPVTDNSTENIKVIIEQLSGMGLTQYHVDEHVNDVKKNFNQN